MVKLVFNPKNDPKNDLESKTSVFIPKKTCTNFNPFSGIESITTDKPSVKEGLFCKDLLGLENCHFILKQWYNGYPNNHLLIIGPTGCGKTTLIELFCKEENIKLLNLKVNDNKTKKELLKELDIFIDYSSGFFFQVKVKKLILIDEYQNVANDILTSVDITELKKKGIPVVIISSDSKGSKLSDFKKACEVYYINEIPQGTLKKWIISLKRKLTTTQINYLIQNCKSDKRMILNVLQFVDGNFNIELFLKSYHKDIDINVFDFTKKLFDDTEIININDVFSMYDNDGFIVSNLVHENYLDYNQDIHSIANAADYISSGEIIFSDTYTNKAFLPNAHCINSIILPSFYSKTVFNSKSLLRSSVINNRFNILLNNKKILNKLRDLDIYDIYIIKNILNQELIKSKVIISDKIQFIKNVLCTLNSENKGLERLEMIYKHLSNFKECKEIKTKSFTIKFKEKLYN